MNLSLFDYALPDELIAQTPAAERDAARLMVVDRATGGIAHRTFRDLPTWLRRGDVLVLNDTRVVPARLVGRRATGGAVQTLFLSAEPDGTAWFLVQPAGRLKPGETLDMEDGAVQLRLVRRNNEGHWLVRMRTVECGMRNETAEKTPSATEVLDALRRFGRPPLPPYIRRPAAPVPHSEFPIPDSSDRERYQTVFARHEGAVAAPTAGLHFTDALLADLAARGVALAYLTLHVGLGTFEPIRAARVEDHHLHAERYEFPASAAAACAAARAHPAGRVVAVGTTAARTLETVVARHGAFAPDRGETALYIHPPYRFRAVDALLTNFHLPRSTLLLLVCAFAGRDLILHAYAEAVRERYRFFSYGDAMLIL
jgi:S-adenosylmethionine:tRNA ribosyltransferase-isomerase